MNAPTQTTRPTTAHPAPIEVASAGSQTPAPTIDAALPNSHPSERAQTSPAAMRRADPIDPPPQGTTASRPTSDLTTPILRPSAGTIISPQASAPSTPMPCAPAGAQQGQRATRYESTPRRTTSLADPFLALAADVLDDLEKVRIANENRLRQLTRDETDADGEERGFGLTADHPDVARLAALVDMLGDAEHKAVLNLQRLMRQHPLAPCLKAQKGVGEKQAARLLAVIGDPYIRPELTREDGTVEPSRPRTVSELWAYCGYHVTNFPAGQVGRDAHTNIAGGDQTGSGPDQNPPDAQLAFVGAAPKRQRGQKANWSTVAKTRTYLIAESCIKNRQSPFRIVYDDTRARYADALHKAPCVRCGPKGKPAPTGSPLSDGHKHARAMRAVSKELLKQLWREARRIHEGAAS